MEYVLIGDDCDTCRYVSNAFSLFRLTLSTVSFSEFEKISKTINTNHAFLLCESIEKTNRIKLKKIFKKENCPLILFDSLVAKEYENKSKTFSLNKLFSKNELTHILGLCAQSAIIENNKNHVLLEKLVGNSEAITKIKLLITQVASSDATVLILGQSGTGKEVIASCIHQLSNRTHQAYVPINCGAIPADLLESELFGHEKGAFTGASARRLGRFELANNGTLFLDEIGDMPLPMQVKLLRVIQDRKVERVGGDAGININVRLIAATNKDLELLIQQHQFREDLFYRLNVFPIQVPSLSERSEDIPLLIDHYIEKIYSRLQHRVLFTDSAQEILRHYSWPGNIRELQNFIERMIILHPDQIVDEKDIQFLYKNNKAAIPNTLIDLPIDKPFDIKDYIAKIEQRIIQSALEKSNGVVSSAAEYLSMGYNALKEKLNEYGLANS